MEGYHSVLCRRSDEEGLGRLVGDIQAAGGEATGFLLNAAEDDTLEQRIAGIEEDIGPIEVVLFNLGAQIGNRELADTSYKAFELGWRMATFALFRMAKELCPRMEARGGGTFLVTSATAAVRGNAGQHSHAAAMGGRRMLCQTLNAEFAPKGIHVAHILIDGAVDAPDTIGKMLGEEAFQKLRETRGMEHDGLLLPEKMAETYYHLSQQHRSAWTHELDLRSFSDLAWWNHR
jgi:NAD(P)-dependent dehydrogenase (short-subunit alcohol dehydrogenase family)